MTLRAIHEVPAPAKLNLFLHVTGRRPDGYHLLQSVFVMLDWCDTLHFEHRADGRLQRHDLAAELPADDLCLRAARALRAASGTTSGVDISIDKQVPWGAGLGGGSSDAASTLLALNKLWGLNWPRQRLLELALPLGADVPFFIGGRSAFVEGIGERLTPIDVPAQWFAVVKPPASIATAAIFASPLLRRDIDAAIVVDFLAGTQLQHWSPDKFVDQLTGQLSGGGPRDREGFGRNDLQPAAEDHCPEVAQAARWLEARYGNSRMSGSGSAVFARAGTGVQPVATWGEDDLPPRWVGRLCRSLDHHPLVGWAD
jgi:4-diphosphocytidyl-2-C-methyl-D-erythritol kinase